MTIHPLKTTEKIRSSYLNYLKTIKPFQDKELRKEFAEALETAKLVKGPLLQIALPYKPESSIQDLVNEGILSPRFKDLCSDALSYNRKLYSHQTKAIRKAVQGRNLVVSTGTGSGKTETFLIPILNSLLQEQEVGTLIQPGVRALLLYPMNALANDQMKRLRQILKNYPEITFGRYINVNETPITEEKANKYFNDMYGISENKPNEKKSREAMHEAPPHILMTNYAMLEYLLLRPESTNLFDGETGKHWRYIVLDEAHVYDGANATEIAMLLRRLQDRVAGENHGKIQGIATSATLGSGEQANPEVAEFASKLFNKKFEWIELDSSCQDIVRADPLNIDVLGKVWGKFPPEFYREMQEILSSTTDISTQFRQMKDLLEQTDCPIEVRMRAESKTETAEFLYDCLKGDENIRNLITFLNEKPNLLEEVASKVFPNAANANQALIDLIALTVRAKTGSENMPLLPARYHTFARALEGAFICLNHDHPNGFPRLFLERHKYCKHCGSRIFEIANCTTCGTSYIVGNIKSGSKLDDEKSEHFKIDPTLSYVTQDSQLIQSEDATKTDYFIFDNIHSQPNEDELDDTDAIDRNIVGSEPCKICTKCGQFLKNEENTRCLCGEKYLKTLYKVDLKKKKTLSRCISCSTKSKAGGVVYRFLTGQDAPVSVIASALYDELPESKDPIEQDKAGQGRKILNFSDNRQSAAFFAPFIQRIHERNLRRGLIFKTVKNQLSFNGYDLHLKDLINPLGVNANEAKLFKEKDSEDEKKMRIAIWLMQEFLPFDRRISLEGIGLLSFEPKFQKDIPPFLKNGDWDLDQNDTLTLIKVLLNTLRNKQISSYLLEDEKKTIFKDSAFKPLNFQQYVLKTKSEREKHISSWIPSQNYENARLNYLKRFLMRHRDFRDEKKAKSKAQDLLIDLWELLIGSDYGSQLLIEREVDKVTGKAYVLDHNKWSVNVPNENLDGLYICDQCKNIYSKGIGDVCLTYQCGGKMIPLINDEETLQSNIYRINYQKENLIWLEAQEHTAQWTAEKAAEIQNQFVKGDINFLSCSTTFELGVDVGDLQVVMMRNMPPTTANYIQRAGRAGRRTDTPAYIMTFAQRRSHDLNHFMHPEKMVAGEMNPPRTPLQNEKILRRHLHSIVFADFFKWSKTNYEREYKTIGSFIEKVDGRDGLDLIKEFLEKRPERLKQEIKNIIPLNMYERLGIEDWSWIELLTNENNQMGVSDEKINTNRGILDLACDDIKSDISFLDEEIEQQKILIRDEVNNNNYSNIARLSKSNEAKQQIIDQIKSKDILGFLGSRNVLPKYGFPVDVVELKTNHLPEASGAKDIDLSRDLRVAIAEFAPGSQVVAAKMLWTSGGLKKHPSRAWQRFHYAICKNCQKMYHDIDKSKIPNVCSCGEGNLAVKMFLIPEDGFVAIDNNEEPGEQPPERTFPSSVYFGDYNKEDSQKYMEKQEFEFSQDLGLNSKFRYSKFGWMVVVNDGYKKGFRICEACGYGQVINPSVGKPVFKHKNPVTNKDCNSILITADLGHRFLTDVLEINLRPPFELGNYKAMRSLLYALLEGASQSQGIRRADIDGTLHFRSKGEAPSIILFDAVPGGAGHVENIKNNLRNVVATAYDRVNSCDCGVETSCYNCLRNYSNQYFHDDLQRGYAIKLLSLMLK